MNKKIEIEEQIVEIKRRLKTAIKIKYGSVQFFAEKIMNTGRQNIASKLSEGRKDINIKFLMEVCNHLQIHPCELIAPELFRSYDLKTAKESNEVYNNSEVKTELDYYKEEAEHLEKQNAFLKLLLKEKDRRGKDY